MDKNVEYIDAPPIQLFGSRDTLQEAIDYANMMADHSESPIHAITPVFVLYNTFVNNYHLIPKDNADNR